jgi:hypothetical protein
MSSELPTNPQKSSEHTSHLQTNTEIPNVTKTLTESRQKQPTKQNAIFKNHKSPQILSESQFLMEPGKLSRKNSTGAMYSKQDTI